MLPYCGIDNTIVYNYVMLFDIKENYIFRDRVVGWEAGFGKYECGASRGGIRVVKTAIRKKRVLANKLQDILHPCHSKLLFRVQFRAVLLLTLSGKIFSNM